MFSITAEAAEAIRQIAEAEEFPEGAGLRLTAEEEGDEISIDMNFAEAPEDGDTVVEEAGARVFLDAQAAELLDNVDLGVQPHGDHVHFEFTERGSQNGEG